MPVSFQRRKEGNRFYTQEKKKSVHNTRLQNEIQNELVSGTTEP